MQDTDNRPDYDDYVRERDYRSSDMGNRTGSYSSSYGSDASGMDQRRDYRQERRGIHAQHFYDPTYGNDYSSFTSEDYGGRDFYAGRGGTAGGRRASGSSRPSYGVSPWFGDAHSSPAPARQHDHGHFAAKTG